MVVVRFLFMVVAEFFSDYVFCLMVVVGFFYLWKWLGFCVNGDDCVFCLIVVVGFLFMVVMVLLC